MNTMCDRCRVFGCCLDYLGEACKRARQEKCPDVRYTNGDRLRDMDDAELAEYLNKIRPQGIVMPWDKWLRREVDDPWA